MNGELFGGGIGWRRTSPMPTCCWRKIIVHHFCCFRCVMSSLNYRLFTFVKLMTVGLKSQTRGMLPSPLNYLIMPRPHRAEALRDDACLTSVWCLSVCRVYRA